MRRKVFIKRGAQAWHVQYLERRKHQRYLAAGFYAQDFTLKQVEDWVINNPKLELVPAP